MFRKVYIHRVKANRTREKEMKLSSDVMGAERHVKAKAKGGAYLIRG
jgi:hypothetical protein